LRSEAQGDLQGLAPDRPSSEVLKRPLRSSDRHQARNSDFKTAPIKFNLFIFTDCMISDRAILGVTTMLNSKHDSPRCHHSE